MFGHFHSGVSYSRTFCLLHGSSVSIRAPLSLRWALKGVCRKVYPTKLSETLARSP